jgi:hypothetical protein
LKLAKSFEEILIKYKRKWFKKKLEKKIKSRTNKQLAKKNSISFKIDRKKIMRKNFLNFLIIISLLGQIKSDDCLVKLDNNGYGEFWKLCFDSLNLNQSATKCENDQMQLSRYRENPNYSILSLFQDLNKINQPDKQVYEIGSIYSQSLHSLLGQQLDIYDEVKPNLVELLSDLAKSISAYFDNLIKSTSDSNLKAKYATYNESMFINVYKLFDSIDSRVSDSKNKTQNTMHTIATNVISNRDQFFNLIKNGDQTQIANLINNYKNSLFNRLSDLDNEVFDIQNHFYDFNNYFITQKHNLTAELQISQSSLGLLSSVNDPIAVLIDNYYQKALNISVILKTEMFDSKNKMKTRLSNLSNGLVQTSSMYI